MRVRRVVRLGCGFARGMLLRTKVDRAGSRLLATGRVRLTCRHGRVELGDHVSLETMKILVVGRPDCAAVLTIGSGTFINEGSELHVGFRVTIGEGCAIAGHVIIRDTDSHRLGSASEGIPAAEQHGAVSIADHVWIGSRAMVLKGVSIGEGAVVAAGAVVTRDVPPYALAAGNPARVIREDVRWAP